MIWRTVKTALTWQIKDFIRSTGVQALSYVLVGVYAALRFVKPDTALRALMDAHRYSQRPYLDRLVSREKALIARTVPGHVRFVGPDRLEAASRRAIILKTPAFGDDGRARKGVLLITFTDTLAFFCHQVDCERLLQYFHVVLEPSWSGYCDPNILFWTRFPAHPVVVQATERKDRDFMTSLRSNLVPVDFGASDWVDFRLFRPVPGTPKDFDAVYVTNYNPIKRHHVLFRAIKRIGDPAYRAALAFGKWGDARKDMEALVDYYGVRRNVTLLDGLSPEGVNDLLNRSKVNVLLSRKEGSNRSIFEGFFANVPGIVLRGNIGVNKDYINDQTGQLVDERKLPDALLDFRHNWARYTPLEWASRNISPIVTTRKLEDCLARLSRQAGEPWSGGLVPKVNAPEAQYFSPEDAAAMPDPASVLGLFLKSNTEGLRTAQALEYGLAAACRTQ